MNEANSYLVIIPARYGSTRFPGKPLAKIGPTTMLHSVWKQAHQSSAQRVVIATDDQRIVDEARSFSAEVVLTRADHQSGTDRLAEVADLLNLDDDQIIVNLQGDEPLMPAAVIEQVANNLATHKTAAMATLSEPIESVVDFNNTNVVKVVANDQGFAQYFSRASIPVCRNNLENGDLTIAHRHIGMYAYRARTLREFVKRGPHAIELAESLEQLRVLMWGGAIHIETAVEPVPGGIDTPEDLERINTELGYD